MQTHHKNSFVKMHAMGNDFVIFLHAPVFSLDTLKLIANRRLGIGCDQVLILRPPASQATLADCYLEIWNADGTQAEACGNGTRCVVALLEKTAPPLRQPQTPFRVETLQGILEGSVLASGDVQVQQGVPLFPLGEQTLDLSPWGLAPGIPLNLGNPHLVVFVPQLENLELQALGQALEQHPFFPNRTNVMFCKPLSPNQLEIRIWERGAGMTPACGSGACAAASAAVHQGVVQPPHVEVFMEGGKLDITCASGEPILQKGPVHFVYEGVWWAE
ncbi:MAG: diaminopimelate epimerase [Alphaproteobacteria bacterium]